MTFFFWLAAAEEARALNTELDKGAIFHFTLEDIEAARLVNESGAGVVETQ